MPSTCDNISLIVCIFLDPDKSERSTKTCHLRQLISCHEKLSHFPCSPANVRWLSRSFIRPVEIWTAPYNSSYPTFNSDLAIVDHKKSNVYFQPL